HQRFAERVARPDDSQHALLAVAGAQHELDLAEGDAEEALQRLAAPARDAAALEAVEGHVLGEKRNVPGRNPLEQRQGGDEALGQRCRRHAAMLAPAAALTLRQINPSSRTRRT